MSQDGMVDEVSSNIVAEMKNRGIFGGFSEERMQYLLKGTWNKLEYVLKVLRKMEGQLEECYYSKGRKSVLDGRTFKYHSWGGMFHMILQ